MRDSLIAIGLAQDEAMKKDSDYELTKKNEPISSLARQGWFLRLIEFYFLNHPPLYFRVELLKAENNYLQTIKRWIFAHVTELLPKKV